MRLLCKDLRPHQLQNSPKTRAAIVDAGLLVMSSSVGVFRTAAPVLIPICAVHFELRLRFAVWRSKPGIRLAVTTRLLVDSWCLHRLPRLESVAAKLAVFGGTASSMRAGPSIFWTAPRHDVPRAIACILDRNGPVGGWRVTGLGAKLEGTLLAKLACDDVAELDIVSVGGWGPKSGMLADAAGALDRLESIGLELVPLKC